MKKVFLSLALVLSITALFAQEIPHTFRGKYHALSEDEINNRQTSTRSLIVTDAPANPRSIAEFEPCQGVIVAYTQYYGFGIPYSLIAELSENEIVYVICRTSSQSNVRTQLQNNNVNMNNVQFVSSAIDSYWSRDYSPWFIEYGDKQIGMIDYVYNRPRPNDDEITNFFGGYFNLEVFGMEVEHTGGNYMTDGLGVAASCSASMDVENNESYGYTPAQLDQIFEDYLGITNYMHLDDPLNDYIAHIDCWGKFLDVDKVLITQVPAYNSQYAAYETMADWWANQTSSYGNKYQVIRTYSPNGEPFSNSLILNNKVYLAFLSGHDEANANAKAVYEAAMPGYEVIGFTPNGNGWESTDALHCRTHEVPRFDMLRIAHYPILDTVEYAEEYTINAQIYSFNNSGNITSANVFYKINDGEYTSAGLTNISGDEYTYSFTGLHHGDVVSYYIKATNDNNQIETHPYIGAADPHIFIVEDGDDEDDDDPVSVQTPNAYIKCFPNPASEVLYFISNNVNEGSYMVEIINQQGAVVKEINTDAKATWSNGFIDISNLANGIYFVRMYNDRNNYTCKFSKL